MKRWIFGALASLLLAVPAAAQDKPNILIIWGDDIGQFNVSAYNMGMMGYKTPNIDRLAAEGQRWASFYSSGATCVPSRRGLMTGRHPVLMGNANLVDCRDKLMAAMLKKHGYRTAILGKWHLGLRAGNTPEERGFDLFHGFLGDMRDIAHHVLDAVADLAEALADHRYQQSDHRHQQQHDQGQLPVRGEHHAEQEEHDEIPDACAGDEQHGHRGREKHDGGAEIRLLQAQHHEPAGNEQMRYDADQEGLDLVLLLGERVGEPNTGGTVCRAACREPVQGSMYLRRLVSRR